MYCIIRNIIPKKYNVYQTTIKIIGKLFKISACCFPLYVYCVWWVIISSFFSSLLKWGPMPMYFDDFGDYAI